MSGQFEFLEDSRANLSVVKNKLFKGEIGRNRPMKRRLVIDNRNHASVDRNGVIKSHPFDQQSKAEVSPRVVCEETRRLISCIGS